LFLGIGSLIWGQVTNIYVFKIIKQKISTKLESSDRFNHCVLSILSM
jgi:hypothetical protein